MAQKIPKSVIASRCKPCCMANNLPYYGYYKYGVMPWLDHGIQSFY
ncbi:hypothetical protein [Rickettsia endosymbiont of Ceutorhynchus obstrictus]